MSLYEVRKTLVVKGCNNALDYIEEVRRQLLEQAITTEMCRRFRNPKTVEDAIRDTNNVGLFETPLYKGYRYRTKSHANDMLAASRRVFSETILLDTDDAKFINYWLELPLDKSDVLW